MLITPRTYLASQTSQAPRAEGPSRFHTLAGWRQSSTAQANPEMLLVHQVGSVRVGEIAR